MKIPHQITTLLFTACLLCGSVQTALCQDTIKIEPAIDSLIDEPYRFPDIKAEYPGGTEAFLQFLFKNINYPQKALDEDIHGTVIIGFTVKVDGTIDEIEIIQSVHESLDNEAIRLIKLMDKWTPAQLDGVAVSSKYQVPIRFEMRQGKTKKPKKNK